MASPSSWRASYDSHYSVFSTFRTNIRRTHFVKFALDDHSSSSSRSKTKNNQSLQKPNSEKVVKPPNSLQISPSSASSFLVDESKGDKKPNLPPSRAAFKFQSGKRPLWKRIFFASKKVRSIMLLNVIAVVFGQLLMDDHPTLFWTPCAAHCIDLMLHDICKLPIITRTVKRAIALNGYIYNHPYVLNMMRTFTEQKELIRPGVTRFATVFLTLQSIYNQKNKLRRMFTSEEWSTSRYHRDTKGKDAYETVMSIGFWNNIQYSLRATGPLVRVLRLVDSEKKPAMGYIYEAMDRAKEAISKSFNYNEAKYYEIWEIIDKRWNDQLHRPLHAAGYYLNPEYFYTTPRIESNEELNQGFLDTMARLVPDEAIQHLVETELSLYRYARGVMGSPNAIRNRALWSPASSIPVVKEVEEIMDPALFTVVRFSVAAIPFLPFVLKARGDSQTRAAGIELGFWVSLGFLTQALGLLTSDAGRASFISAFTVVAVPLIDGMLGATVPALTWSGAVVSLIGVALLESSGSPPSVGDILNLLSAVFFGVHILRTEHISRVTKKENYLPLLGYEVCVVAIFSAIWYLFMGGFSDVQELGSVSWTWLTIFDSIVSFPWVPALYTGVFSTGLCLWVEMAAMCDVSATETAIIYGLEPLWGAAFAWFLLGERWGITGWIGAALVLGGSLAVQIFGSAPGKSVKGIEKVKDSNQLKVSDRRNDLSTSVVTVSSRDDVTKLWKKK